MLQLAKPPQGTALLRWNKELPSASAQDPLGLNLRLSARLAAELLHCITSITPRARYYSFFPWAFQDYLDNEHGRLGDRGRVRGVLVRERAMVLGTVFHHDGDACEGGALGGSDKASSIAAEPLQHSYDLDSWRHLKAREGQFGAAYKASLINLGFFKNDLDDVDEDADADTEELAEDVQSIEVTELSEQGRRLARAFQNSIQDTRYLTENWSLRSEVAYDVLQEFGSQAGLCEIGDSRAEDRTLLRDVFFSCDRESVQSAHYRRRMSLLLLLESIRMVDEAGVPFDQAAFNDLTYFGRVVPVEDGGSSISLALPETLQDIAHRWRIFRFHGYLSLSLQSFLVGVTRVLRDHPGGIERSRLFHEFDGRAIRARFRELLDCSLTGDFFDTTPSELLAVVGVDVKRVLGRSASALDPLSIDSKFGEHHIAQLLQDDGEANQVVGLALAALLLYSVLLKYQTKVDERYDAWYQNHVQDRFADVSVPGVLGSLRSDSGDAWWHRTNREILDHVIWRFVLLQHQTMSYERGFGGSAPLFHIDATNVIGTETDYTDPSPPNARFPSAVQILDDLGLVTKGDGQSLHLSSEGKEWVRNLLDQEAKR